MDVLVRGFDAAIVKRLDEAAAATGVSRNAHVLDLLTRGARSARPVVTPESFRAAAELTSDLGEAELMHDAWR